MQEQFSRTELLLGSEAMEKLAASHVAVFGVGGVGGYVTEALARSGVGAFTIVDNDTVCLSNLNRQIIATHNTIGKYKVDVMKDRILSINPQAVVTVRKCFFLPENADSFDFGEYSYVVDAIDTVTAKLELVLRTQAAGVPILSSMGTGNKLDPTQLVIGDIYETSICPLARVMRRELRKRQVEKLKVLYSTEESKVPGKRAEKDTDPSSNAEDTQKEGKRSIPGSTAFVPPAAGLMIAAEVVRELTQK